MKHHHEIMCSRCKEEPVEVIDDWASDLCPGCADILAERYRERQEFEYYHPVGDKDPRGLK